MVIGEARFGDNFIVAAHPNEGVKDAYELRLVDTGGSGPGGGSGSGSGSGGGGGDTTPQRVLKYRHLVQSSGSGGGEPEDEERWDVLPAQLRTSILTIYPSVDIDTDSDNTDVIERSDWEEEIENEAGYPGKSVPFNDNDDNGNSIGDYLENADYVYPAGLSWVPFTDPNLVPVVLDRGFEDLSGMDGFVFELKVTIGRGLRYWLNLEKTPITADDYETITEAGKEKGIYRWYVSGTAVSYPSTVYVEGVDPDALTDTLIWRLFKPIPSDPPGGDPTYEQLAEDTVKMTDPYVIDLDVDSENNGYINNPNANPQRTKEEEKIEDTVPKPITYFGAASSHLGNRMIPMNLRITNNVAGRKYSFQYDPGVFEIRRPGGVLVTPGERVDTYGLFSALSVLAVGPGAAAGDAITAILWEADGTERMRDTVLLAVQDNSDVPGWVVPNDWKIGGTGGNVMISTPTPVEDAVGPKIEGTGVEYNEYNMGDAYTTATYEHGFELKLDYELTRHFVRPDYPNQNEHQDASDLLKHSYVANSGVKIGPLNDNPTKRYEVAIIDLDHWLSRAVNGDIDALEIDDNGMITFEGGYGAERVGQLLPGMVYLGEYKSEEGLHKFGLTDADGLVLDPNDTLTPVQYKELLKRTRDCWDTSSMIVRADPHAADGKIKVYMKRTCTDISHEHTDVTHPTETNYYLFYRTNRDRDGNVISFGATTRVHLQSHWGSEVTFTRIEISPLPAP